MASNNEGYWSRSWALLTRDEGWFKPLLVLGAAKLVPVIGSFGVDGYALEWGRLTSWGVDSSPKQKDVDLGACIKSGARAFVVALGYGIVIALLRGILTSVLGDTIGGLLSAAVGIAGAVIMVVAKLRATVYQRIGAGYQLNRIVDMIKADYQGLLRVAGMYTILLLAVVAVVVMMVTILVVSRMGDIIELIYLYEGYGYVDDWRVISTILGIFGSMLPLIFVFSYLLNILTSFMTLMTTTATGLWMRQFDVQSWGESSDPLPGSSAASTDFEYGQDRGYQSQQEDAAAGGPEPVAEEVVMVEPVVAPAPKPAGTTVVSVQDLSGSPDAEVVANEQPEPTASDEAEEVPTFALVPEAVAEPMPAPEAEPAPEPEPEIEAEPAPEVEAEPAPKPVEEPEEPQPVAQPTEQEAQADVKDEHPSQDDLLANVTEAIHAADMSTTQDEEGEVATFPLEDDASSQE